MIHWWLWTQRGGGNVGPVSAVTPAASLVVPLEAEIEPLLEGADTAIATPGAPAGLLLIPDDGNEEP